MNDGTEKSENKGWETLAVETHYRSPHVALETVEVRSPARSEPRRWTVARRKKAVVIAAMTLENKFVLVRQERIAIRSAIWEMPAGQLDDAEASPDAIREVALRELNEETGFELSAGGELTTLGCFYSSPGFTDEQAYLFFVRPVQPSPRGHAHEESESILDCRAFTASELAQMIAANQIEDANTLSVCARLAAKGLISLTAH